LAATEENPIWQFHPNLAICSYILKVHFLILLDACICFSFLTNLIYELILVIYHLLNNLLSGVIN